MASIPRNFEPPEDWITDPKELNVGFVWGNANSPGQEMAREHGLIDPQPIMCSKPHIGCGSVLFKSGDKFYIWGQLVGEVFEITLSRDFNKILQRMYKSDTCGLKLKAC
ncbi:hypothetical protein DTO212C5_226 [Paecilomyces variotii]|nr:hypothetical protein DTO212C5_226 [Paecilomyces variotii]